MKNRILVHRKNKPDCEVSIMYDRYVDCYCFVNLTSDHVCNCRFTSFENALKDLLTREDVLSFKFIK